MINTCVELLSNIALGKNATSIFLQLFLKSHVMKANEMT